MKLFIKLRNKYLTGLLSLVLLVMASIGLFNLCNPQSVDASMIKFDNEKTITNGSFSNFSSSSSYPRTLSDFTNSGNKTPEMKTGAIDVSEDVYKKNYTSYGLSELNNPGKTGKDSYILMINTAKDSNYTYTSKEFTLPANGYYYITVSAKTIGDNANASVFLTENNVIYKNCVIENISSTTWSNYTFFVSTNPYESVTLKFGMQIGNLSGGTNGCVLFDELHAAEISSETFFNSVSTFAPETFKYAESRLQNACKVYDFDNTIIEFTRDSKGNIAYDNDNNPIVNQYNRDYFSTVTAGATGEKDFDVANNTLTLSTTDSYITYKGEEEVLDANSTYRFSMFVKASELKSGSAFVKLDEIIDEDEDYDDFMESEATDKTPKSSNLTISSTTSNTVTNGYVEYVIYVRTGALEDSKVQLSFGLGTDTENATGTVSFKSYQIERVPYSAYSDASTGSSVGKIDIAERLTLSSNEYSNFTFDKMQSDSFDGIAYPATPDSWTKSTTSTSGYQLSGVVNLSKFDKVMAKYKDSINTMSTPVALNGTLNNNVLMIYNGTNSTQSYTSSSKSLSANKYYKITTFVNTHLWNNDSHGVTVLAKSGSNVLGQVSGIKTAGDWQKVVFYINTSSTSVDLTLELALGYDVKTSSGYAFFDNILVEEADAANDFSNRFSEYEVATNGEITLDLTNPMLSSTTSREYNIPVLYSGENKGSSTVMAGIVDLTSDLNMIAEAKREALRDLPGDSDKVLAISAFNDSYYEYVSVLSYTFSSGTYYKLSFDLFTDSIGQEEKEEKYDNGVLAEGVNIELTNLENAKFSYIQSDGKWTTYEIYIGISSGATSNLIFSLGSNFTGCYGKAFLGNISLTEIDEEIFTSSSNSSTVLKVDTAEQTEEDENTSSTEKSGNNFNWAYIPTIATFLAIVVAVVGIFIRRNIKFKKRVKSGKAEYDRDITVMQNKYRRLASDLRAKEVRELTKERDELVELRTQYEEKYKEALSRLRSTRLANRDGSKRHEIMAIEHEVKHISKEVARFGVQVNNYDNEIEFMQTEAYLIDLEKRMMREDNSTRNQLRKESEMSDEDRAEAVAKREAKQARAEQKAQLKSEKLVAKQQKLQEQREAVQTQLEQAKALDEKYVKEQELKQIKLEEQKLAKEKLKAERELQKLEQRRRTQESVKNEEVDQTSTEQKAEEPQTEVETTETKVETVENEVETTESGETEMVEAQSQGVNDSNVAQSEKQTEQVQVEDTTANSDETNE